MALYYAEKQPGGNRVGLHSSHFRAFSTPREKCLRCISITCTTRISERFFLTVRIREVGLVAAARARWKIENENNNVLKTKGYHLEHNFGHGKKHLSSLLLTMNLLAFCLHTLLELTDTSYRLIRSTVGARRKFFQHLEALTTYLYFETWERLMDFMMRGLEIGPYAPQKS